MGACATTRIIDKVYLSSPDHKNRHSKPNYWNKTYSLSLSLFHLFISHPKWLPKKRSLNNPIIQKSWKTFMSMFHLPWQHGRFGCHFGLGLGRCLSRHFGRWRRRCRGRCGHGFLELQVVQRLVEHVTRGLSRRGVCGVLRSLLGMDPFGKISCTKIAPFEGIVFDMG